MSETIDNIPAAFPVGVADCGHGGPAYFQEGMSLRDWFAGQALCGLMPTATVRITEETIGINTARWAYTFADAMLAARKASPPTT